MKYFTLSIALFSCILLTAQADQLFEGVKLGQPLDSVKTSLQSTDSQLYVVEVENPSFPLSKDREEHLICLECESSNGTIKEVAFSFADDRLTLIQAKGNAYKSIIEKRQDTADVYMNYLVYWDDLIVTDKKADMFWILSKEAAHTNLFAWKNPHLPSQGGKEVVYDSSAAVPQFIKMGGNIADLRTLLANASEFTNERELGPGDPNAQIQIDCFGIQYAGFPRKFEARFGDEKLNMVWILTGKGEEDRIRQKLTAVYGEPIYVNEAWEVFEDWQVFLRKDKPEVLLLTAELGAFYKKDYFKQ